MEFTDQEKQFIIQAMDAHVRNHGVNVAGMALVIISKLQQPAVPVVPEKKDEDKDPGK